VLASLIKMWIQIRTWIYSLRLQPRQITITYNHSFFDNFQQQYIGRSLDSSSEANWTDSSSWSNQTARLDGLAGILFLELCPICSICSISTAFGLELHLNSRISTGPEFKADKSLVHNCSFRAKLRAWSSPLTDPKNQSQAEM
jgi:hypothetical protein